MFADCAVDRLKKNGMSEKETEREGERFGAREEEKAGKKDEEREGVRGEKSEGNRKQWGEGKREGKRYGQRKKTTGSRVKGGERGERRTGRGRSLHLHSPHC